MYNIKKVKIPFNYVLCSFEKILNDEMTYGTLTLKISTFHRPVENVNNFLRVEILPNSFIFDKKQPDKSLMWKNEHYTMDIGDTVFVPYDEIFACLGTKATEINIHNESHRYFEQDNRIYLFIRLDKIIYSINKKGEREMQNGYILAKREEKELSFGVKTKTDRCTIEEYSHPNTDYFFDKYSDDNIHLLKGECYVYNDFKGMKSVNDTSTYIDGFLLLQRKDLIARICDNELGFEIP